MRKKNAYPSPFINKTGGITLIELMIALGLFAIFSVLVHGSLEKMGDAEEFSRRHKQAKKTIKVFQKVFDNDFVLYKEVYPGADLINMNADDIVLCQGVTWPDVCTSVTLEDNDFDQVKYETTCQTLPQSFKHNAMNASKIDQYTGGKGGICFKKLNCPAGKAPRVNLTYDDPSKAPSVTQFPRNLTSNIGSDRDRHVFAVGVCFYHDKVSRSFEIYVDVAFQPPKGQPRVISTSFAREDMKGDKVQVVPRNTTIP